MLACHDLVSEAGAWNEYLNDATRFIYLAEDENPFGFVCAGEPITSDLPGESVGEVIGLYLLPGYWGHGMGRKLLVRGLSVLKRRHFEEAFLWVRVDADGAIGAVRSLGFDAIDMHRETNLAGGVIAEQGYRISLDNYF